MMLGVGNITELTHADTSGMNALLLGICSELNINHILATEVSKRACRAIREADRGPAPLCTQPNNTTAYRNTLPPICSRYTTPRHSLITAPKLPP